MHQYKIEIWSYTEKGAVGSLYDTQYADSVEQARLICNQYERQRQDNGMKAYKVDLYLASFKLCPDKAAFFAQFQE